MYGKWLGRIRLEPLKVLAIGLGCNMAYGESCWLASLAGLPAGAAPLPGNEHTALITSLPSACLLLSLPAAQPTRTPFSPNPPQHPACRRSRPFF